MTDWAIPQQAKLKYTQLFNLHDRSRSGFLSGLQCRDILLQSGLPRNILADIWNLSDIDGDGQLTREEFILAMHLTNHVRSGHALPAELSADLIPPSYRRTRSISTTSVHSTGSSVGGTGVTPSVAGSVAASNSTIQDDQLSQKSSEAGGKAASVLNTNSFEDKRRENFEKGRAELERRRLKMIEQQTSVLNEQLTVCKKQVAEAKAKIDKMRSDRDTKAGLITSLEAQLQTIRDRKAYLDHEELDLIAIAKDLNLVNSSHSIELDQQATKAKQEAISQMKEKLMELQKEKELKAVELPEASKRLEECKQELKCLSEEVGKKYEIYKEEVAKARVVRQQIIEENKNKTVDLDSAWDSTPGFNSSQTPLPSSTTTAATATKTSARTDSTPTPFGATTDDPWTTATTTTTMASSSTFENNNAKLSNEPFAFNDAITMGNNNNFEPARDYSALTSFDSKRSDGLGQLSSSSAAEGDRDKSGFGENNIMKTESGMGKRKYRALYAFDARNVDELTMNPGDIIIGTEMVCEPGWLSGESNGRSGLFPEAYVELLPASEAPVVGEPASGLVSSSVISNNSSGGVLNASSTVNSNIINSSSSNAAAADPFAISKVNYKVIYEFDARNPDELTIKPGDIIAGIEGPHEPGWLMGELGGQRGLFPEAYVEKMSGEAPAHQQSSEQTTTEQTTGVLRRGSSSGSLRSKKSRAKKSEVATVIANYRALGQEQLNLEKGQLVSIRRKMDSGWWEGELQIKDESQLKLADDKRNELDHLIDELISSEWDFVNDLRLCQSAYIFPLSSSFDNLINSIVDLYVDYCSHQNESTKQLEVKLGGDIRFRQIVNESQRKLKKLLEQQVNNSDNKLFVSNENDDSSSLDAGQHSRALRNSNLPLTSFLIKPMQRITKYSLIFDRILKIISQDEQLKHIQHQVEKLRTSAVRLCHQVNEACRLKEDDEENRLKLRWCQNHIKQNVNNLTNADQANMTTNQDLHYTRKAGLDNLAGGGRLSGSFSSDSTCSSSILPHSNQEVIMFNSSTNCLGPRRLIKASSFIKIKASGRELVGFLFNDLFLLTQIKGSLSLRVEDVFKSERAQQAYYKPYKLPILLEDLQLQSFDEEQLSNVTCSSINSSNISDHEDQIISFLDKYNGICYNLMAISSKEKAEWTRQLDQRSHEAREARAFSLTSASYLKPLRKLSSDECIGRLFVTVLELDKVALSHCTSSPQTYATSDNNSMNSSWERRSFSSSLGYLNQSHNVCLKLQLRRYKRNYGIDENDREVIPLSDVFKTRTMSTNLLGGVAIRSSGSFVDQVGQLNTSSPNGSPRHMQMVRLEQDCTQFMIPSKLVGIDFVDYLDIELFEDSRFKETKLIARKRINIDQLLGRESAYSNSPSVRGTPRQSIRGSRASQPIQPNRPVEKVFKLKPVLTNNPNKSPRSSYTSPHELNNAQSHSSLKLAVKLRLHLQMFRDNLE